MHGTLDRNAWSAASINDLRQCIEQKLSASQTALVMGITRNAAIGKATRLGLNFASETIRNNYWKDKPKPVASQPPLVGRLKKAPFIRSRKIPPMAPEPMALRLTVAELKNSSCRYIVTDDHPMLYCGQDKADGFNYCAHHCSVMYRPPEARIREPRPR